MASAVRRLGALTLGTVVFGPLAVGAAGYAAVKIDWKTAIKSFVSGPGRTSRILLLFFVLFNWKSVPFAWTFRIFYSIFHHTLLRKSPPLTPRALFKPMITPSHSPMLEIDYNFHKSNSTYFSDLDTSRSHLVSYLCRPSLRNLSYNTHSKLILDPKTQRPVDAPLVIGLGSVECSFKREIPAYKPYEVWSRVLSWDRKWFYIATHFMPKGAAKPTEWLDPRFKGVKTRGSGDAAGGWDKKIYASAVSKYVFKLGRLTVHPAVVMGDAGLLPERPGGWMSGEAQVGDESVDLSDVDLSVEGPWDWRRVEAQRRQGMEMATHLHSLDEVQGLFDGGSKGALARFGPC